MQFTPRSEKEVSQYSLIPKGEYDFEVLEAEDCVSKNSGNEQIKLKLGLYVGDKRRLVWDYLLPALEYKLRHFCDSVGLLAKYENGTLTAEDCVGRSGKCKIDIQRDPGGFYEDKNVVKDYVLRPAKPLKATQEKEEPKAQEPQEPPQDDLPF